MTDPPTINPYQPPGSPMPPRRPPTPGVWTGYVVYCILMALMYFAVFFGGVALVAFVPSSSGDPMETVFIAVIFIGMGLVLGVPYAVAPFLPKRPWSWILGIVLIGFGLTSCLTLPFAIALLIYWFKPENQVFFGKMGMEQIKWG